MVSKPKYEATALATTGMSHGMFVPLRNSAPTRSDDRQQFFCGVSNFRFWEAHPRKSARGLLQMLRPPPFKPPEPVNVATPPPKKDIPESLIQATLRPPAPKEDAESSAKPQADSNRAKPEDATMPRSTSPGTEITTQTDEEMHVAMLQSLAMHLCSEVTENVEAGTAAVAGLIKANDNTMKELEAQGLDKKTLSAQLDSLRSAFAVLNGECVAAVADSASARDEVRPLILPPPPHSPPPPETTKYLPHPHTPLHDTLVASRCPSNLCNHYSSIFE